MALVGINGLYWLPRDYIDAIVRDIYNIIHDGVKRVAQLPVVDLEVIEGD
jgi:hypothetical protein